MESPKMLRKCFLCTKEFEGSGSMTDLSSSQISLMFQVFQISPDDTGKYLLRVKFQNVCYCSECLEIISSLSGLAAELEVLEEKVSTEKRNVVDRLRQSCAKFSEKINGPPGMLQILRTEIITEIDKVCARKRVRANDFSSTSEMKKQNRPRSKSTQTDHVYDYNSENSCRIVKSKIKESPANEEETGELESNHSSNLRKKTRKDNRLCSKSTEPKTIHELGSPREKRYLRSRMSTKSVPGNSSACVDSGPLPNRDAVVGTETEEDENKLMTVPIDVIHDKKTNGKIKKEESARCETPTKSTTKKSKNNSIFTSTGSRKRTTAFYQPKKCEECGQILSNLGTWRNHVLAIHQKEGKHKCELCDYICLHSGRLKEHMASSHSDVGNFECDLCKKTFKTMRNLKQHQRIHEGDTPYECDLCSAKFKYSASLCVHKARGHCKQIKVESPLVKRVKVPRDEQSVRRKKSPNP